MSSEAKHQQQELQTPDGVTLFSQDWHIESPKGTVLIVHGLAEHCGRYAHVAKFLVDRGYNVYTYDQRGHGNSSGTRAHIDDIGQYLDDLHMIVERIESKESGRPLFFVGHSMGGLVASLYTLRARPKITGLALSNPVLKAGADISALMIFLAKVIGKLFPKLPLEKLKNDSVSRDPKVVEAYDKDPLNYRGGVRAGLGAALLRAFDETQVRARELQVPLLVMQGSEDKMAAPEGGRLFYQGAGSQDKTLKVYEGLYHEIFNEPEKEEVLGDLVAWLDAHL